MSAIDQINANGQDYDIMSPEVVSDYVEKLGTICKNPNGYTKGSLFLARDAQGVERMYKATANITSNQTITVGTNCTHKKLGDLFNEVDSEVGNVKQALTNEVATRATLGAHNLLQWSDNVGSGTGYTIDNVNKTITFNTTSSTSQVNVIFASIPDGSVFNGCILSGNPVAPANCVLRIAQNGGSYTDYVSQGNNTDVVISGIPDGTPVLVYARVYANKVVSATIKPMIRLATDTDTTYRPYAAPNSQLLSYKDNGVLGAKNLFPLSLESIKTNNSVGTWNNNVYTITNGTKTITFTVNSDLSISISGTAPSDTQVQLAIRGQNQTVLNTGTYIMNGAIGASSSTFYVYATDGSKYFSDEGNGVTISLVSQTSLGIALFVKANVAVSTTIKPMIRLASDTDPTYQPYAMTNRELTDAVTPKKYSIAFESGFASDNGDIRVINGICYFNPCIYASTDLTVNTEVTVGVLPEGCRPIIGANISCFATSSGILIGLLKIFTDGTIKYLPSVSGTRFFGYVNAAFPVQ